LAKKSQVVGGEEAHENEILTDESAI
jgi:hypothetical protein